MNIEGEIEQLKERNRKVEADKAWETSWFRILLLTGIVYVTALLILLVIKIEQPFFNALIAAIAYFLSMQSLPKVKQWWVKKYQKKFID